jgi:hypothetical protein
VKKIKPESFIQIHYHDRPGGVNSVISQYARAFDAMQAKFNCIICSCDKNNKTLPGFAGLIDIPECNYRTFKNRKDFIKTSELLASAIGSIIGNPDLPRPICIIGHNLTLGKNCALSAAFSNCAEKVGFSDKEAIFISVVHDFAEEGRIENLTQISFLEKKGLNIKEYLYPTHENIRYISPNARNVAILKKAHLPAQLLLNPVTMAGAYPAKMENMGNKNKYLSRLAKKDGTAWKSDIPVLFYPCRCIYRKNILEAILISGFVFRSNLLLGSPGTSAGDTLLFKKAIGLCKKHLLPVIFDCNRIFTKGHINKNFSSNIYDMADACITTSIAEGFGYALHDPWLLGKTVVGRKPMGFSSAGGMDFTGLYESLPIPASWVDVDALCEKYHAAIKNCLGNRQKKGVLSNRRKFDSAFVDYFVKDDTIDFGCLDVDSQLSILEKLCESPDKIIEWNNICGNKLVAVKKKINKSIYGNELIVQANKNYILEKMSLSAFSKNFLESCRPVPFDSETKINNDQILQSLCSFDYFRLLLAPGFYRI